MTSCCFCEFFDISTVQSSETEKWMLYQRKWDIFSRCFTKFLKLPQYVTISLFLFFNIWEVVLHNYYLKFLLMLIHLLSDIFHYFTQTIHMCKALFTLVELCEEFFSMCVHVWIWSTVSLVEFIADCVYFSFYHGNMILYMAIFFVAVNFYLNLSNSDKWGVFIIAFLHFTKYFCFAKIKWDF